MKICKVCNLSYLKGGKLFCSRSCYSIGRIGSRNKVYTRTKLVCGVGINDADYAVYTNIRCKFYMVWKSMLSRCYSKKQQQAAPTYKGCSVCDEWLTFSKFKSWMETQDWEGKQLDKDLLVVGNKVYSPETCVFISKKINVFITDLCRSRQNMPLGAYSHKECSRYSSVIGGTDNSNYLGMFDTPEEAHQAWLTAKLEQAKMLAESQDNPKVAKALIKRYEDLKNGA